MRNFLIGVAIVTPLVLAYFACKKTASNPTYSQDVLITEAQNYFDQKVIFTHQSGLAGIFANIQKAGLFPLWRKAYTQQLDKGKVTVVPLDCNLPYYANTSQNPVELKMDHIAKLLIYKDSLSKMHAEIVMCFPDALSSSKTFSGIAITTDWNMHPICAYKVTKNKSTAVDPGKFVLYRKTISGTQNSKTPLEYAPPQNCSEWIDWYQCAAYSDGSDMTCSYQYSQCTSYSDPGVLDPIVSGSNIGIITGGGSGTPSDPSTTFQFNDINNKLTNPCFITVFNSLISAGLKNDLTSIIVNTFGATNGDYDLDIGETSSLPNNVDAKTTTGSNGTSGSVKYCVITLSEAKLMYASEEFVAEVMFHECIHAYLNETSTLVGDLQQHCEMITTYVDCEVTALQEVFPTLTTHDALCLVLSGMGYIQQYDPSTLNTVISHYSLTLTDVNNTSDNYRYGNLGDPCTAS